MMVWIHLAENHQLLEMYSAAERLQFPIWRDTKMCNSSPKLTELVQSHFSPSVLVASNLIIGTHSLSQWWTLNLKQISTDCIGYMGIWIGLYDLSEQKHWSIYTTDRDAVVLYFADTTGIAVWVQNEMKSWLWVINLIF